MTILFLIGFYSRADISHIPHENNYHKGIHILRPTFPILHLLQMSFQQQDNLGNTCKSPLFIDHFGKTVNDCLNALIFGLEHTGQNIPCSVTIHPIPLSTSSLSALENIKFDKFETALFLPQL